MAQTQKYVKPGRVKASRDMQQKVHEETKTRSQEEAEAIKAELDDMLDEIDEVLDGNEEFTNAQAFVEGFVQKGGQHHLPFGRVSRRCVHAA